MEYINLVICLCELLLSFHYSISGLFGHIRLRSHSEETMKTMGKWIVWSDKGKILGHNKTELN